jgi:catechol 2,3-dioxygenase-like lactoylglutathione lyase family enzyme
MTLFIEHVALGVTEMERSLLFYRDTLGLRVVRDMEVGPGGALERITGLKNCRARIVHIESGNSMLELFEYHHPSGHQVPHTHSQADKGFIHIGFTSADINADYARLRGKGVQFQSEPVEFRPSVWVAYFRGPDGETCELRQILHGG